MIRVIVADDHPIVRQGLRRLLDLQPDMTVVAEACDGADVVQQLASHAADVLVLDLSLPHLRGLELVHVVRETAPDVAILVFSAQPEDRLTLYLLEAGARGYVCKDDGVDAVVSGVRRVAAGGTWRSPRLRALAEAQDRGAGPPHDLLSPRERQVFERLLAGLGVNELAAELEITPSTASNHVARVRDKLGVRTTGEILLYAARAGLLGRG